MPDCPERTAREGKAIPSPVIFLFSLISLMIHQILENEVSTLFIQHHIKDCESLFINTAQGQSQTYGKSLGCPFCGFKKAFMEGGESR